MARICLIHGFSPLFSYTWSEPEVWEGILPLISHQCAFSEFSTNVSQSSIFSMREFCWIAWLSFSSFPHMASRYHKYLHINTEQIAVSCTSVCLSFVARQHVYPDQFPRVAPMSSAHCKKVIADTVCPGSSYEDKTTFFFSGFWRSFSSFLVMSCLHRLALREMTSPGQLAPLWCPGFWLLW